MQVKGCSSNYFVGITLGYLRCPARVFALKVLAGAGSSRPATDAMPGKGFLCALDAAANAERAARALYVDILDPKW